VKIIGNDPSLGGQNFSVPHFYVGRALTEEFSFSTKNAGQEISFFSSFNDKSRSAETR
jgi:hypothetical protein